MITNNRILRDTFTDHKANAYPYIIIRHPRKYKQPRRYTSSLLPHPLEVTVFS